MTPDRWRQVTAIFHAARAMTDAAARATYLSEACESDPSLRADVEALLDAQEDAGPFGEQPVGLGTSGVGQLAPGSNLGPYQIRGLIDVGGMGEVYRAHDTTLNRDVAVKVLPESLAGDAERLARFQREAQALGSLNHPNIVTVHAVEEVDGVHLIAMELVEGRNLSDLVMPGGMALETFFHVAIPLVDAIAAAHKRGIVHRDLKPSNVMVTAEDRVKVLDFGLAKLQVESDGEVSTALGDRHLTEEGKVLGTVAYMSPEQAEGKPLDHRTDIFSAGIMLYEMATGMRPFKGERRVSMISAILKDTPSSITDLRPGLPTELARIVKRCLTKDPERRYQSAIDLRNDLEELRASVERGEAGAGAVGGVPVSVQRRPWFVVAVVTVSALTVILWLNSRAPAPPTPPTVSLDDMRIRRLTSTGSAVMAALSPDGKYVVHVLAEGERQSLWVRQTVTSSNVQVRPPEDVRYSGVTISPDGAHVYYSVYEQQQSHTTLYRVPVLGGTPRKILENVDSPISFSPDGSEFVFVRGVVDPPGSRLVAASADGSAERVLVSTASNKFLFNERPSWSPDGAHVAFAYLDRPARSGFATVELATGEMRPLGDAVWRFVGEVGWLADDTVIVVGALAEDTRDLQLWRIGYPDGEVTRVTDDLESYKGVTLSDDSSALVSVQGSTVSNLWVAPADDLTASAQITKGSVTSGADGLAWTPDGRIVYSSNVSGNFDIWIADADGSGRRQITSDPSTDASPAACGDGPSIVFTSETAAGWNVYRTTLDSTDPVFLAGGMFAPMCAPRSDSVVYANIAPSGRQAIWRVPLDGGDPLLVREAQLPMVLAISPDGRTVAGPYVGQRRSTVVVRLDSDEPPQALPVFPLAISWSPDGKALDYVRQKDGVDNIWRQPLAGDSPYQVTHFQSDRIYRFAWSHDGQQLVLARGSTVSDVVMLSVQ